jgi:hypothetical protein
METLVAYIYADGYIDVLADGRRWFALEPKPGEPDAITGTLDSINRTLAAAGWQGTPRWVRDPLTDEDVWETVSTSDGVAEVWDVWRSKEDD